MQNKADNIVVLVDKSQSMTCRFNVCLDGVCQMVSQKKGGVPYKLRVVLFSDEHDANAGTFGTCVYTGNSGADAEAALRQAAVWHPCNGRTRYYDNLVAELTQVAEPATCVVVVATDGEDTASTVHTNDDCKDHVLNFEQKGGQIIYLGMADTPHAKRALHASATNSGISAANVTVGSIKPIVAAMRSVTGPAQRTTAVTSPVRRSVSDGGKPRQSTQASGIGLVLPTLSRQHTQR